MSQTAALQPLRGYVETDEVAARCSLRAQIAKLERDLCELFVDVYPRQGIQLNVQGSAGPRVMDLRELEQTRDRLVERLEAGRRQLAARRDAERANRRLVERMIAEPAAYKWVQVSAEDVGERGCKHWHSLPKLGIIGMMLGWWRVRISSGCPLSVGRGCVS